MVQMLSPGHLLKDRHVAEVGPAGLDGIFACPKQCFPSLGATANNIFFKGVTKSFGDARKFDVK